MSLTWRAETRLRPDPYLDWEARTRVPGGPGAGEPWCSLEVRVVPDGTGEIRPSLEGLRDAALAHRQPEDPPLPAGWTLTMSADEFDRLEATIAETAPLDQARLRFFIYRPERLAYLGGEFTPCAFYAVIHAGPPLPGETLNLAGDYRPSTFAGVGTRPPGTVAIGIIDDGIAFAHERFRRGPAMSRIEAIWLQEIGDPLDGCRTALGRVLDRPEIEGLFGAHDTEGAIYRAVGLLDFNRPGHKPLAKRGAHGTHCLDLAAGDDPARQIADRPIFAVQLPPEAVADASGGTLGSYIVQGVRQIMLWADNYEPGIPLVITFSYGITAGPKDGTHYLEEALDSLIESRRAAGAVTHLVLPAGNSYRARGSAYLDLAPEQSGTLGWIVEPDDETANFLEIWLDGTSVSGSDAPVTITLTPPRGGDPVSARPRRGQVWLLSDEGGLVAMLTYDVSTASGTARGRIVAALGPTRRSEAGGRTPAGRWGLALANAGAAQLVATLSIQRDVTPAGYPRRGRRSSLDHPEAHLRDPETGNYTMVGPTCPIKATGTLSAIANGRRTLVVGAATRTDGNPPSSYTASGPTDGRAHPDCSAFADEGDAFPGILAAGARSGATVAMNGTSVAAPQVARRLADAIAAGGATIPAVETIPADPLHLARLGPFIVRPRDGAPRRGHAPGNGMV